MSMNLTHKCSNFKTTKMDNGSIAMEYIAKADTPGYTKRYVQIINSSGNILKEFNEIISPDGSVKKTKILK